MNSHIVITFDGIFFEQLSSMGMVAWSKFFFWLFYCNALVRRFQWSTEIVKLYAIYKAHNSLLRTCKKAFAMYLFTLCMLKRKFQV